MIPLAGSHSAAAKSVWFLSLPDPETIKTCPLLIKAMWTGLMGIRYGRVCHWPWTFDWAKDDDERRRIRVRKPNVAASNRLAVALDIVRSHFEECCSVFNVSMGCYRQFDGFCYHR